MRPPDLDKLRESGRISATARETCKAMIKPGARLAEIAETAETIIREELAKLLEE